MNANTSLAKRTKYINLDYLNVCTKHNDSITMEMISIYLKLIPRLFKEINQGLQIKNWNAVQNAAHQLISSLPIMGLSSDYQTTAKKIQEYALSQKDNDRIPGLVLQLENVCVESCKELKEEFNILNSAKI